MPGATEGMDAQAAWDARIQREHDASAADPRMRPPQFRRHEGTRFVCTASGNWVRARSGSSARQRQRQYQRGWNAHAHKGQQRKRKGGGGGGMGPGLSVTGQGYRQRESALNRQQEHLIQVMGEARPGW